MAKPAMLLPKPEKICPAQMNQKTVIEAVRFSSESAAAVIFYLQIATCF